MFRQKRGGKREGLRSSSSSGIHWYFIATCLGFAFFTSVLASTTLDAIASAEQNTIFLYSNSFRHGHAERWWDDKGVYNNMRKKNRLSSFPATNVLQWRNFRGGGSGTSRPRMGNIALPIFQSHLHNESPSAAVGVRRNPISKGRDNAEVRRQLANVTVYILYRMD